MQRRLLEADGVLHPGHEAVLVMLALMVDIAQEAHVHGVMERLADRLLQNLPTVVFEHAPVLTRVYMQRGEARVRLAMAAGKVGGDGEDTRSARELAELAQEDLDRAAASYKLCFGAADRRTAKAEKLSKLSTTVGREAEGLVDGDDRATSAAPAEQE